MISKTALLTANSLAAAVTFTHAATTWNAGADLVANETPDQPSETLNPNATVPEWSYGSRDAIASTSLTLFGLADHTNALNNGGAEDFEGWQSTGFQIIVVNVSNTTQFGYAPGVMLLHPRSVGETNPYNIIRWTAPAAGIYDVSAYWEQEVTTGDGIDSHIVVNGVSIFDTFVTSGLNEDASDTLNLNAGDFVDFVVGPGPSGLNNNDSTRFNATITLVPEPSSALLAAAALPFLMRRRRVQGNA